MNRTLGITRREFARLLGTASALGLIESQRVVMAMADNKRSLNYLANRTAGAEGNWELTKIEGKVPRDLNGTLIRTAPGQKETFGVALQHLFDGDAFLSKLTFQDGKVRLQARFLDTPQRLEEQQMKRMLYPEVGTLPPSLPEGYKLKSRGKNQPSVNIIQWDGRYLGLSEGARSLAGRLEGKTAREKLAHGFRIVTARRPTEKELDSLSALLDRTASQYSNDAAAARKLAASNDASLAPWVVVSNVLLNLDEAVTKE